eukprot:SAG31_NODE_3721_length_3950_cov_2.867048_4_plen_84_part_00
MLRFSLCSLLGRAVVVAAAGAELVKGTVAAADESFYQFHSTRFYLHRASVPAAFRAPFTVVNLTVRLHHTWSLGFACRFAHSI